MSLCICCHYTWKSFQSLLSPSKTASSSPVLYAVADSTLGNLDFHSLRFSDLVLNNTWHNYCFFIQCKCCVVVPYISKHHIFCVTRLLISMLTHVRFKSLPSVHSCSLYSMPQKRNLRFIHISFKCTKWAVGTDFPERLCTKPPFGSQATAHRLIISAAVLLQKIMNHPGKILGKFLLMIAITMKCYV